MLFMCNNACLHCTVDAVAEDIPDYKRNDLEASVERLETDCGYLTSLSASGAVDGDVYHVNTVWFFEQAVIHIGAVSHQLCSHLAPRTTFFFAI